MQLPVAGEPVQVVDVGGAEGGVLLDEIAQGGHEAQRATPTAGPVGPLASARLTAWR